MDLLRELYKHPAYKDEDIELARRRYKISNSIHELKEIIDKYKPTERVVTVDGGKHYRECRETKRRLGGDTCGCHCFCFEISSLYREAKKHLDDIEASRKCTLL